MRHILPCMLLSLSWACASEGTRTTDYSSSSADANPNDYAALFHDEKDYDDSELSQAAVPCATPLGATVVPWPAQMKPFLAKYVAQLDAELKSELDLVGGIAGIYLIDVDLSNPAAVAASAAAVTCRNLTLGRSAVFIDASFAIDQRQSMFGAQMYQWNNYTESFLMGLETRQGPDRLVATLIHELFHTVDYANFLQVGPTTVFPTAARLGAMQLSWTASGSSLFSTVGDFDLTDSQSVATDYIFLADQTNVITPYAMTNFLEDWAETLEVVFMVQTAQYERRTVYAATTSGSPGAVLADYDQSVIVAGAEDHGQHKTKACQLAALVYTRGCQIP